jgi:leukotriene-A4 hydrolase
MKSALSLLLCASAVTALPDLPSSSQIQYPSVDGSTFSNVDTVITTHIDLDIYVNFGYDMLQGNNTLSLKCLNQAVFVVLDVQGIDVFNVWDENDNELFFDVKDPNPTLGQALIIYFKDTLFKGDTMNITIKYQTNSESLALNWLTPAQTAGKRLPYLFTQCEPAYCRSVAPMQDTPATKITYTA